MLYDGAYLLYSSQYRGEELPLLINPGYQGADGVGGVSRQITYPITGIPVVHEEDPGPACLNSPG